MDSSVKGVLIDFDVAVDIETARLVREGVPLWVAVERAVKIVRQRMARRMTHAD